MKFSILILVLAAIVYGDISGRLDSFEDIGYLTPKQNFIVSDNVYFRTYFDKVNETVLNVTITEFYTTLSNGTIIMMYKDGAYYPPSQDVYLILGNRNNLNEITTVLNLNPTIFDVPRGTRQATSFTMRLYINFVHSGPMNYPVVSQIIIGNSKRDIITSTIPSTGCKIGVYFAAVIVFCIGILV